MMKKKTGRKKNIRDYYKEIGKSYKNIKWRPIKFSKATEDRLKAIARKTNVSVNYLITKLINRGLNNLNIEKLRENLKNSKEF
ncbi:MAG: hypothetical protein AAB966_04755 [Patescibacteria group bacterium]